MTDNPNPPETNGNAEATEQQASAPEGPTVPKPHERSAEVDRKIRTAVERMFETIDGCLFYRTVSGYAQLATELEQVVLHVDETGAHVVGHHVHGEHDADGAIGLIDSTVGLDARTFLRDAAAVTKAGRAVVAGPGVNFAESVAHWFVP